MQTRYVYSSAAQATKAKAAMAAIRHKLSARPSSGTPSSFSSRGGVMLLKTFANICPSPDWPSHGVARYQGKKLFALRYYPPTLQPPYNRYPCPCDCRHALAKIVEC